MKLLIIYADRFGYKTTNKGLDTAADKDEERTIENVLVAFIHAEEKDENNLPAVETKLVKQLKWAARKNNTEKIMLHSFAHLSDSKASPEATQNLFSNTEQRLTNSGYEVYQTPFGYFLDLELKAPGYSLARLFKNI